MIFSASSLLTPFLKTAGAFSTNSLASFNPRSVKDFTSLIILIFAPESNPPSSFKSNIVFSALAPTLAPHLPFNPSGLKPIPGIIIVITGISSTPIFFLSSVRPEISSTIPNTASDGSEAEVAKWESEVSVDAGDGIRRGWFPTYANRRLLVEKASCISNLKPRFGRIPEQSQIA
nr:50S ribosomal protein L7/L12 [Ipomoea batatas]